MNNETFTRKAISSLAVDSWNGEGDLETFSAGFVAAWLERSELANVTIEARDKRIAELEALLDKIGKRANAAWTNAVNLHTPDRENISQMYVAAREGLIDVIEMVIEYQSLQKTEE